MGVVAGIGIKAYSTGHTFVHAPLERVWASKEVSG